MKRKKLFTDNVNEIAIVIGSYINGLGIVQSLIEINYAYPIVVLETNVDKAKTLIEVVKKDKKLFTIKKKIRLPIDIINHINSLCNPITIKRVFLTSETFLDVIKVAIESKLLVNTTCYIGSRVDNELIFDRFKFYQVLGLLNITNYPLTIDGIYNPIEVLNFPFILRPKKSWVGNIKTPRISIISNEQDLQRQLDSYQKIGLESKDYCYQELLSISDMHNISVCGWYDRNFHQYVVTRKLVQHPPKIGNGDVVEIFFDYPEYVLTQTTKILEYLKFEGPFEMEFVLDLKSNEYKCIELNPRFWMQHGLIEDTCGNMLVRKYLGQELERVTITPSSLKKKYWINGNQLIYRLLKGQLSILAYLKHGTVCPTIFQSVKWAFYYRKYKSENENKI